MVWSFGLEKLVEIGIKNGLQLWAKNNGIEQRVKEVMYLLFLMS